MAAKATVKKTRLVDAHHEPEITEFLDSKGNTISLEAKFPYLIRENENSWIVYTPFFNTLGYSNESEKKAVEDFEAAIGVFFKVHQKRGTLEKALIHFGWLRENNSLQKPKLFNLPVRRGVTRGEFNLSQLQLA